MRACKQTLSYFMYDDAATSRRPTMTSSVRERRRSLAQPSYTKQRQMKACLERAPVLLQPHLELRKALYETMRWL